MTAASDRLSEIAACPEPFWHDTHRYCPHCPWTERDLGGDRSEERAGQPTTSGGASGAESTGTVNEAGVPGWFVEKFYAALTAGFSRVCIYCGAGLNDDESGEHEETCDRPLTTGGFAAPEEVPSRSSSPVTERDGRSFVERANGVRRRIPFFYWIAYDGVVAPFLAWGYMSLSEWFAVPFAWFAVAAFFDVNEAFVKWERRRS